MINCSDNTYYIYYTDAATGAIAIPIAKSSLDQTTVDITLVGKTRLEYGEIFNENLLHLLENFASGSSDPLMPDQSKTYLNLLANPVIGQLWYNNETKTTAVCITTVPSVEWKELYDIGYVAGNSGILAHGEYIPLPISQDGYYFAQSECVWHVSPYFVNSDTTVTGIDISAENRLVHCEYKNSSGTINGIADYMILGVRNYVAPEKFVIDCPPPSITPTLTFTPTPTITRSPTPTVTSTPLSTPVATRTPTPTPTIAVTPSVTVSVTPTIGVSVTPTPTLTPPVTVSSTAAVTPTPSPAVTNSPTITPTRAVTPTVTATPTVTPTLGVTITPTVTVTPTLTVTPTVSITPSLPASGIAPIAFGDYFADSSYSHDTASSLNLTVNRDGTWAINLIALKTPGNKGGTPISGNWSTAPSAAIGDNYEVMFVPDMTSGVDYIGDSDTPPFFTLATGWLDLSASQGILATTGHLVGGGIGSSGSYAYASGSYVMTIRNKLTAQTVAYTITIDLTASIG